MRSGTGALALSLLVSTLAACSSGGDGEQRAATTTPTQTAPTRTATGREEAERSALLDAVAGFFAGVEIGRCVAEASTVSGDSRPTTLRAVAREVERIRGLSFRRLPRPLYLEGPQLERRIRRELARYPAAELANDAKALLALGALPRGTNLRALLERTFPGQVAGFYDPETSRLVVGVDADKGLGGIERLTLAHELEHALVDQALGFPRAVGAPATPDGREDEQLAGLSLVEGDATLLTEVFGSEHLSLMDSLRSIGPALAADLDFKELPYFLRASVIFPYGEGLGFVCSVVERGGWKAVDRAYRQPPTTTAQVMFPERYFARERAVDPPVARPSGRGWKLLDAQAFGAASLLWLFEAPGGDTDLALSEPRERAAAWAGGELRVWGRRGRTAVTLSLVQRQGGRDLCASTRAWFRAADRRGAVRCSRRLVAATLRSQ